MIVYDLKTMQACEPRKNTVVALGAFDGCHIGHLTVFKEAHLMAKSLGCKSLVYTFDSVPKTKSNGVPKSIHTLNEKIRHIAGAGIDYIAIDSFEDVKDIEGREFVKSILMDKLRAKGAVCGYNYRFGKGAECDSEALKEILENYGGRVKICGGVCVFSNIVSSSLIREKIIAGEVEEILNMCSPYSVYAPVVEGKRLGRTIGVPTINQIIPKEKITPKRGVYVTECEIGEDVYPSVTNVGVRPSVEENGEINMETHIIGYSGNLYGSYVRVNFYKRLRDEIRFSCLDELKKQIEKDASEAVKYFK